MEINKLCILITLINYCFAQSSCEDESSGELKFKSGPKVVQNDDTTITVFLESPYPSQILENFWCQRIQPRIQIKYWESQDHANAQYTEIVESKSYIIRNLNRNSLYEIQLVVIQNRYDPPEQRLEIQSAIVKFQLSSFNHVPCQPDYSGNFIIHQIGDNSIKISWEDLIENPECASYFTVQYCIKYPFTYYNMDQTNCTETDRVTGHEMVIHGLQSRQTYQFQLSTSIKNGMDDQIDVIHTGYQNYLFVPYPDLSNCPSNEPIFVIGGQPMITRVGNNSVKLSWKNIVVNPGLCVSNFVMKYWSMSDDGESDFKTSNEINGNQVDISFLTINTTYQFQLIAQRIDGSLATTNPIQYKLNQPTCDDFIKFSGQPSISQITSRSVKLNWENVMDNNHGCVYKFRVKYWIKRRRNVQFSDYHVDINEIEIDGLTRGKSYIFQVIAASGMQNRQRTSPEVEIRLRRIRGSGSSLSRHWNRPGPFSPWFQKCEFRFTGTPTISSNVTKNNWFIATAVTVDWKDVVENPICVKNFNIRYGKRIIPTIPPADPFMWIRVVII